MNNREHIGVLVLATLVSVGAVGVALFTVDKSGISRETSIVVAEKKIEGEEALSQDTDNDGLPDWKEGLLGTDPKNPDTDGDGVSDSDEFAQNADPLVFGVEPREESTVYEAPRGLPTTEALARELFSRYATLKAEGNLTAEETNEVLADLVKSRVGSVALDAPIYTKSQISIENDVTLDAYQSSVVSALGEATRVREYELNVFARAVSENRTRELAKLKTTALIYESIGDTLLTLEVPVAVADEHVEVLNSLALVQSSVHKLSLWGGDPLDALTLVNSFSEAEESFQFAMNNLFTRISILKKS